ncbi:hypothetical protein CMEL01_16555 [Colletotrichum melonis]|uniref:Nephrocystin 3-like N-terminal domain-containing protein n=1 Tax=Colletotrichum melonis TaxID=1209925 RepID=A0AAI9UHL7_9PEZI|nr:hypothetical protein CMEL01_16555 [Colletotrichum melonis]
MDARMSPKFNKFLGLKVLWTEQQGSQSAGQHRHDIIFVHSLNSDPISNWTTQSQSHDVQEEDSCFWPVDLLAKDIGQEGFETRILSFGYGTDDEDETKIFHHGERLCCEVEDMTKVTPGESGLTNFRHEHVLHLYRVTHQTICRFRPQDDNYDRILRRIKAGRKFVTKDGGDITKIRDWINLGNQPDPGGWNAYDFKEGIKRRHGGTCEWFWQDYAFRAWAGFIHDLIPRNIDPVLWVTGPGGVGKSVLTSFVIEKLSALPSKPATPYIMLSYKQERSECQMAKIIASQLLDYLIETEQGVDRTALGLLNRDATQASHIHGLIRLLVQQCSSVYFVVDGLNEVSHEEAMLSDTSTRGASLNRLVEELRSTLEFLHHMTKTNNMVRLWCSSQSTDPVVKLMSSEPLCATAVPIKESRVRKDVQAYLVAAMDEVLNRLHDPEERASVAVKLLIEAGENFRWAYMMQDSLRNCRRSKDIISKVEAGLPRNLRQSYLSRLDQLVALDRNDEEDGNPPLSINILSILAFARRPMQLQELQEAISIVDSLLTNGSCPDLTADNLIRSEDIMHRCTPLVDFVPLANSSKEGYLVLSHGSVYEFLREPGTERNTASGSDDKPFNGRVKADTIADACLKYLSQERYASLLKKRSANTFETRDNERVREHRFLFYAAKYWYRHLETTGPERLVQVKDFLLSPQFLTAIQVQSLYVIGHFINTLNREDEHRKVIKRNIPDWFRQSDEGRVLVQDYEVFLDEWSRFLQLGVTSSMNGEIQSENEIKLVRNMWFLDGKRAPFQYGSSETVSFDPIAVEWHLYDPFRTQEFSLIPAKKSLPWISPVADSRHGLSIRIGAAVFRRRKGGQWAPIIIDPEDQNSSHDDNIEYSSHHSKACRYWEDVVVLGPFEVRTRRTLSAPRRVEDMQESQSQNDILQGSGIFFLSEDIDKRDSAELFSPEMGQSEVESGDDEESLDPAEEYSTSVSSNESESPFEAQPSSREESEASQSPLPGEVTDISDPGIDLDVSNPGIDLDISEPSFESDSDSDHAPESRIVHPPSSTDSDSEQWQPGISNSHSEWSFCALRGERHDKGGEMLRIFKIPLTTEPADKQTDGQLDTGSSSICTLENNIVLPRSGLSRPVYFFPNPARVVLGSTCGATSKPRPPAVVYLGAESMGAEVEKKKKWKAKDEWLDSGSHIFVKASQKHIINKPSLPSLVQLHLQPRLQPLGRPLRLLQLLFLRQQHVPLLGGWEMGQWGTIGNAQLQKLRLKINITPLGACERLVIGVFLYRWHGKLEARLGLVDVLRCFGQQVVPVGSRSGPDLGPGRGGVGAVREELARGQTDGVAVLGGGLAGLAICVFVGCRLVVEVLEIGVFGRDVEVAVVLARHVLLHGGGGAPLRAALETLVVSQDDEVEVPHQRLEVDDESLLVGDEYAVGLLHVLEVVVK